MIPAADKPGLSHGRIGANLAVFGCAHALVDVIGAGILFTLWQQKTLGAEETGFCFLLFNLVAFGLQPVLGLLLDRWQRPRDCAIAGCLLAGMGVIGFSQRPLFSLVLVGLGNALFHIGAGSICLQLTPGRAAAPGIFVAPGAIGLFLGSYLGQSGTFASWPFILMLLLLCGIMLILPLPAIDYRRDQDSRPTAWTVTAVVLLLACIGGRSLTGGGLEFPWKTNFVAVIVLTACVFLGKGLGGVIADRLGWRGTAVGAVAVATPLLAFGAGTPAPAIAGMFLFNIPMAVTLAARANLMPGRPAFAFGLSSLALEAGIWPVLLTSGGVAGFDNEWIVFGTVSGLAVLLYLGLQTAFRRLPHRFARVHP